MMKEREYILLALTSILVSILVIFTSCTRANASIGEWVEPEPLAEVEPVILVQQHPADECYEDEVYWWVTDQGYRQCQPLDDIIGLHIEWMTQQGFLRWES